MGEARCLQRFHAGAFADGKGIWPRLADQSTAVAVALIRSVTFPERSGRSVCPVAGAQPAGRQAPASAEVTARRLQLATIALGALVVLAAPIGIAGRQRFDGFVLLVVLIAVLGWLITRRQPGNRIGLLLAGFAALIMFYQDAANYAVLDYHLHHGALPLGFPAVLIASELSSRPGGRCRAHERQWG